MFDMVAPRCCGQGHLRGPQFVKPAPNQREGKAKQLFGVRLASSDPDF
jgi:hypothetical protein